MRIGDSFCRGFRIYSYEYFSFCDEAVKSHIFRERGNSKVYDPECKNAAIAKFPNIWQSYNTRIKIITTKSEAQQNLNFPLDLYRI